MRLAANVRHAAFECGLLGCTSIARTAGLLALEEGLAPGAEALEAALSAASGFRWLDQDNGWFTLRDTNKCAAAHRVRKMMCVVQEAIGADQIAAAFVTDDR